MEASCCLELKCSEALLVLVVSSLLTSLFKDLFGCYGYAGKFLVLCRISVVRFLFGLDPGKKMPGLGSNSRPRTVTKQASALGC